MNEDDLLKIVCAQEDQIRWQRVETGYFWDGQGNLLLVKAGEPSRITFTTEELALVQGAISTHNHPHGLLYAEHDSRRIGHSFSASDVRMACLASLSILRIVTPKLRYMMKPSAQGWDKNYWANVIEPEYRLRYKQVWDELKAKVQARKMLSSKAYAVHLHEVWQRVAMNSGLNYSREEF